MLSRVGLQLCQTRIDEPLQLVCIQRQLQQPSAFIADTG